MEFACIDECSQCCTEREYYPSIEFGKIGVLILPEERERIEGLAARMGIDIRILPRVGVSREGERGPEKVLAYQLMGTEDNGNTCPFLDTGGAARSPHGGLACRIYRQRPLACAAYPLTNIRPQELDPKCKFCKEHGGADGGLDSEAGALLRIQGGTVPDRPQIWRYATGTGEPGDAAQIRTGWIPER